MTYGKEKRLFLFADDEQIVLLRLVKAIHVIVYFFLSYTLRYYFVIYSLFKQIPSSSDNNVHILSCSALWYWKSGIIRFPCSLVTTCKSEKKLLSLFSSRFFLFHSIRFFLCLFRFFIIDRLEVPIFAHLIIPFLSFSSRLFFFSHLFTFPLFSRCLFPFFLILPKLEYYSVLSTDENDF